MRFYCENCGSRYESDKVSGGQKVRCKKCNATFAVVPTDENDPLLGQQVGGCRLIRKLGQGGMGSVYRAYMLSLDKAVAIKILSGELGRNEEFIQRFFREARAAAKLEHHNIVQVLNVGEDKAQHLHYIIMQFVDGQALTKQIRQRGKIPQLEALDLAEQVVNGLKCAHDKGIIHRDIKPDNIMIASDGVAKVADFGLAKSLEETAHLTTTGTIMGTPHYMSPEQCRGEELDPRSDLYSLGVVFYEMLSGHLPFTAPSPVSVMMKHTTEEPKPLREIAPDIHPEIEGLVKSMMTKDRQKRLQTCGELLERIKQIRSLLQQPVKNVFQPAAETVVTPRQTPVSEKVAELTNPPISTAGKAPIPLAIWIAFASVGVVLLVILILLLRESPKTERIAKNPSPTPTGTTATAVPHSPTAPATSTPPPNATTPSPAPVVETDEALAKKFEDVWKQNFTAADLARFFPEKTLALVNFCRFDRFKGTDVPPMEAPGEIEKGVFNLWLNPLCAKLSAITEKNPDLIGKIEFLSTGYLDKTGQIIIFRFREDAGHEKLFANILTQRRESLKIREGFPLLQNEKSGEYILFIGNVLNYYSNEAVLDQSLKCYLDKSNTSNLKNNSAYRTLFKDENRKSDVFVFIAPESVSQIATDANTLALFQNALQLSESSGISVSARARKNSLECNLNILKKKNSAPDIQPRQFESLNWLSTEVPFQVCLATKDAKKSLTGFFELGGAFYKPLKSLQARLERQTEKRAGLNPEDDFFPYLTGECGLGIMTFGKKDEGDRPENGIILFGTTNDAEELKRHINTNVPLVISPADELSSEKGRTFVFKFRPGAKKILNGPGVRGGYILGASNWTAITANMHALKMYAPTKFPKPKLLKDDRNIPAVFLNSPANMLAFFDVKPLLKIQLNEPRRMLCVRQVEQDDAILYDLIIPIEKFLE